MSRSTIRRAGLGILMLFALAGPAPARASGGAIWAMSHGGPSTDLAHGVAVAPDGATFIAGRFTTSASFGGKTLTSAGASDFFVAAFDAARAPLWSIRGGGKGVDWVEDIARLPSGDIVVAGSFDGRARIGPAVLTGPSRQMFIARLAAATGQVAWAVDHGGAKNESVGAVATNANGDIFVTGTFTGPASFGALTLANQGRNDIFVAKYDGDDGRHLWSKGFGSPGDDAGTGLAVAEDVYVTGRIGGSVDFGGNAVRAPVRSAFVARLTGENGGHRWSRALAASGPSQGASIALDPAGEPVVAGYFQGSFGTASAQSAGSRDAFLVKLAAGNGALTWTQIAGGPGSDVPYDIAIDIAGDVLSIGSFAGTASFGTASVAAAGGSDLFVSLYDGATGTPVWATGRGSRGNDRGEALALDVNGNALIAGWVGGAARFSDGAAVATDGGKDALLASFAGDDGLPVSTISTAANAVLVNVPGVQTSLISGRATDDRIGISRIDVTFTVPAAGVVIGTVQATMECSDEMRSCAWTVAPPVNPGPMTVTVKATDRANNVESPGASVTVINI